MSDENRVIDLESDVLSQIEDLKSSIELADDLCADLDLRANLKASLRPIYQKTDVQLEALLNHLIYSAEHVSSDLSTFVSMKYHSNKVDNLKTTIKGA